MKGSLTLVNALNKETNIKISIGLLISVITFLLSATVMFVSATVSNNNFHETIMSDVDELEIETDVLDERVDQKDVEYADIQRQLENIDSVLNDIKDELKGD